MKMKTTIKLCIGVCLCMFLVSCSSTTIGFLKEPATIEQELENVQHSVLHEISEINTVINSTSSEPLQLRLADAVVMAMDNNPALTVSKFGPALQRTIEDVAGAVFDPVLSGELSHGNTRSQSTLEGQREETTKDSADSGQVALTQFLATGTTLELGAEGNMTDRDATGNNSDLDSTAYGITICQSLLQGRGTDVNLAALHQAQLDTRISQYELQAVTESQVSQVEIAYWELVLARQSIDIYERSLVISEQQAEEIEVRIQIGAVADTELAAAKAETAERRESLINAQSDLDKAKLQLHRMLSPDGTDLWIRDIDPIDVPDINVLPLEGVEAHVMTGLNQRPEIQQAMLEVEKNELEVMRTGNGLLPKLDLFVRLGNSSYANSFSSTEDEDGNNASWTVGVQFEYALGRRAEKAAHRYAKLSVIQTEYALENMKHLAQLDIRTACVEIKRASAQINASTATRKLREEVLRTEEEKFRVGRSTALLVSQASRDLLTSQIDEVDAVISYRKALLELYRTEGTLLDRRGIALQ